MGSTFTAASAVEALKFDFTVYRPVVPDDPEHPDYARLKLLADEEWAGTIPEPTDDQVQQLFQVALPEAGQAGEAALTRFRDAIRSRRRDFAQANGQDPATLDDEALEALELPQEAQDAERDLYRDAIRESRTKAREGTLEAVAAFTSGHPSRLVLEALPWRAFQMFTGWLTGQFSPEALTADING